jgi:hypothetical protein
MSSYGAEAHPFVYWIARTKLHWTIDRNAIADAVTRIEPEARRQRKQVDEDRWKSSEISGGRAIGVPQSHAFRLLANG